MSVIKFRCDNNVELLLENYYPKQRGEHLKLKKVIPHESHIDRIVIPDHIPVEDREVNIETVLGKAFDNVTCGELLLPDSILIIEKHSLRIQADKVTIPKNVRVIPSYCFDNGKIGEICFKEPAKIKRVESYAFSKMKRLSKINWPCGCKSIPSRCFADSAIEEITGIEGVESIGYEAFANTLLLKHITWPMNCTDVAFGCFSHSGLQSIDGLDEVTFIDNNAFENLRNLQTFRWPQKCETIPAGCFKSSEIKRISNTENVTKVSADAFFNSKLQEVSLPNVRVLGSYAFASCELSEVSLGGGKSLDLSLYINSFSPEVKVNVCCYDHVNVLCNDMEMCDRISNYIVGFDTTVDIITP